jgi:hypothetical protein
VRGGVFVGSREVSGHPRALGSDRGAPTGPWMAFASKGASCSSKAVVKTAHGETWPVSRLAKIQVYDNGPMDPWPLHHDH